jgi:hypothetical protein
MASFYAIVGLAILAFIAAGTSILQSIIRGVLLGGWALIAVFAVAEIATPARFIKWRARMVEGGPEPARRVGAAFDKVLSTNGSEPWRRPQVLRRVRLLGSALLLVGTPFYALFWFLLANR